MGTMGNMGHEDIREGGETLPSTQPTPPIRPVEQATVTLFGHTVRAVRLPDERVAAVFSDLTRALGLVRSPQARRVRDDETISDQLVPALIFNDDGAEGSESMSEVLTAWAIPTWLTGIRLSMVPAEKRPTILAFKREAADALYRHFAQRERGDALVALLPAPVPAEQEGQEGRDLVPATPTTLATSTVETLPPATPPTPAADATLEERIAYHEAMLAFLHWRQDVESWRTRSDTQQEELAERVESLEAQVGDMARLMPDILERLGSQPLSPAHQAAIQQGVTLLNELTKKPHAHLYNDLRRSFKVGSYNQIPDARWSEVVTWFRVRIQAAEKQAGTVAKRHPFDEETPEQGSLF